MEAHLGGIRQVKGDQGVEDVTPISGQELAQVRGDCGKHDSVGSK